MQLNHEFTVQAPIEQVWQALLDPERVAPCMPGATLTGVDGDTFTATVQVKLGPVNLKYQGKGEFVDKDEQARTLVIKAAGKDVRGAGTASGTSTLTLSEVDGGTHGAVASDLKVTGRPAQFGRGLIAEVSGRLLGEFAANLADELSSGAGGTADSGGDSGGSGGGGEQQAAAEPEQAALREPPPARPQREPEAINLLEVAGVPLLKRLAPVLAVLAAVLAVAAVLRSRGSG